MHRIKLLILKARVFALVGMPEKGFSIILRAASSAHRALLLPVMWEALAGLCVILLDLGEFAAVRDVVDAVVPQVCFLSSLLFLSISCPTCPPSRLRDGRAR